MTEFEYLAILLSIIVGLGLTHIISGMMRNIFARQASETHLVYSAFAIMVIILNWWVIFSWEDQASWSFDEFLLLVIWAFGHYLIAITLYPPSGSHSGSFENYRHWFMWSFFIMTFLDIAQTAMRGDLFNPWFYLLFVLHYSLLALIGALNNSAFFHRLLSWWFLIITLAWSLIVRRFLL